jgi:Arc/MetJ-type ribon-helix-helix transcriptional regulator
MTREGNYQVKTKLNVRVPEGDIERIRNRIGSNISNVSSFINIRVPENDMERIKRLIPKHFANESDFVRCSIRELLDKTDGTMSVTINDFVRTAIRETLEKKRKRSEEDYECGI